MTKYVTTAEKAAEKMRLAEETKSELLLQESIAYSLIAITEVLERMYNWDRA